MTRMSGTTAWSTVLTVCLIVGTTLSADDAPPAAESTSAEAATAAADRDGETAAPAADGESQDDASPEYRLRYRVAVDEVLRYRSVKVGELSYSVGQQTKTDVERVEQIRRFEVRSVEDDGSADLVMQFESVEMSLQVNGGAPLVYRSTMDAAAVPSYFAGLDARLRGSAPRFRVTPRGAPVDEEQKIIVPPKEVENPPETRLMLPLPEELVKVGDAWKYFSKVNVRISEDFKRDVPMMTTCRLESVEDGIARIRFSTSPSIKLKSIVARAQLVSAMPHGYCLLDLEAGRIIRRVSRNNSDVHGVHGPQSLLTYSAEVVEELLPNDTQLSQR